MKRIVFALALALAAASCVRAPADVLVGAVYPVGGGQGIGGIEEYRGVQLAAELANRDGGVDGRRIRLSLERTDSAEGAPDAVRRAAKAGAQVVLGSYGSTISLPAADEATRRGVVFWETGAVGMLSPRAAAGERVFRVAPAGAALGRAAIEFVRDRLAPRLSDRTDLRYAVAYVDDVYGRAVAAGAVEEIAASKLRTATTIPYSLASADYDEMARRIATARSDVLFVVAYLDDGVKLREAILRNDVPLLASIGTSSSYCMREFGALLGDDAVGLFASDKPEGDLLDPGVLAPEAGDALRWAKQRYTQRWDEPMSAPALAGFAGAWALFAKVMPQAPSLSSEAIARAAREARLPMGALPNGSGLEFAPPGHAGAGSNMRAQSVIWEWVKPGVRAIVWPPSYADSPIVLPESA